MTKKELKIKAQDMIMKQLANIGYSLEGLEMGDSDKEELEKVIKQQGDRVAKMFGFDEMWFG